MGSSLFILLVSVKDSHYRIASKSNDIINEVGYGWVSPIPRADHVLSSVPGVSNEHIVVPVVACYRFLLGSHPSRYRDPALPQKRTGSCPGPGARRFQQPLVYTPQNGVNRLNKGPGRQGMARVHVQKIENNMLMQSG